MPEGPEIRNYFLYIKPLLIGRTIRKVEVLSGKYTSKLTIPNIDRIQDLTVSEVLVKGKTIFIKCEYGLSIVFVHGMTGYYSTTREKHSRIQLQMETSCLYYNDPRNFGTIKICNTETDFQSIYDALGPDILNNEVSYEEFYFKLLKKPKSRIGVSLLDQKLICGIGNYLRCDILWYSKIHHDRTIGSLTEDDLNRLYIASVNIIRYHAELGYDLEYEPENEFFVYMQDKDIFGNPVKTEKYRGRTVHYVEW